MEDSRQETPRVTIYHAEQCDPKKCTGIRLSRMKKAELVKSIRSIPHRAVVLNPISETALSPEDAPLIIQSGLVALDCSWKQAESIFKRTRFGNQRALPYLLAANPINTYKPIKLSTAEAIAAALYIAGLKAKAAEIMAVFKWGSSFITLNKEWLDAYAECHNSTEVVEVQREIMESQGYTMNPEQYK